jgi:threonine aldolase
MPMTVDLRSDTFTQPTAPMRRAMADAEVGDDVFGEDPTVNALQRRCAEMLGKEAALFVPSGTMANLLGQLSQTRPGDTVILDVNSHPYNYESANMAVAGGLLTRCIEGEFGILTAEQIAPFIKHDAPDHHGSPTTLICVENTHNRGGGSIYPLETLAAIHQLARRHGLRVHCDGARIFNAVIATGTAVGEYARFADTVSFCFSKGLGCPVGSVLCGEAATIDRAHRFRKMLGGGMRQAGILAAAALYALDHHVDRLAEDHARCRRFRDALEGTAGLAFRLPNPTNMVFVDVPDAGAFAGRLADRGVKVLPVSPTRIRAVFHLDVDDEGVEHAVEAFRDAASAQSDASQI